MINMENRKNPEDMNVEELIQAMDEDAANIGLVIADLYRAVSTAMKELPNMELHTEVICLQVTDDGIMICVGDRHQRDNCDGCYHYDECHSPDDYEDYDDYDEDEEERIYDEL